MKKLLFLLLSLSAACITPPPDPEDPSTGYRWGPVSAGSDGGIITPGTCGSVGIWSDNTTCNAGVFSGCYFADFGCTTPSTLGTVPAGCFTGAAKLKGKCGDIMVDCVVEVGPTGRVTAPLGFASPGQAVCVVAQ